MDTDFEMILIACLDALDAGESIEQVLARYPDTAEALRPVLETAAALPGLALQPSASAQADSRRAFLNRAAELLPAARPRLFGLPFRLGVAIALLAALLTVGGGTVAASASAVPGDALYGVKRTVEQVEVVLAPDKLELARELEQRRRNEVQLLIRADRPAAVTFTGTVEAIDGDSWTVDGISVTLGSSTQVEGTPQVGARAVVAGRTDGGFVRATEIVIVPGSAPPPTAAPAPTLAPTATPVPTRAPSPTVATSLPTAMPPSPTLVPTLVPTPVPTLAPTPRPAPPTRAPTAVPAPPPEDNNDNDNSGDDNDNSGDDNGNDNDNSGDDNGNSGDDNGNDNDNSGDDNDNSGDDNGNSGDDNGNSGDDNDNSGDDSGGDSDDSSGSGSRGGASGEDDD